MYLLTRKKFTIGQIRRKSQVWQKAGPWFQTYTFLFLEAIFIFFIVSVVLFIMMDQVYETIGRAEFKQAESGSKLISEETFVNIESKYDLSGSFTARYFIFLEKFWDGSVLSFRLEKGVEVGEIAAKPFLTSFKLGILAVVIGVSAGTVIGLLAARKPGSLLDKIVSSYVVLLLSLPVFVTGLLFQYLSYKTGNFNIVYNEKNVASWLLPIFTLAAPIIAGYARFLKTTVREELVAHYINLAKSKGVSSIGIAFKHILKPSLYPLVTNLPFAVLLAFTGAIVTESVYGIDGAGTVYIRAIQTSDTWLLMYLSMIYTLMSLVAYVVRDLSYPLIDPQAKVEISLVRRRQ